MGFGNAKYLVTDPNSELSLERGKLFVADFMIENGPRPGEFDKLVPDFEAEFISAMQKEGHEVSVISTTPVFGSFDETVIQSTAPSDLIPGGSGPEIPPMTLVVPETETTVQVTRVVGVRIYFRVFSAIVLVVVVALATALSSVFVGLFIVEPMVPVFIGIAAATENLTDAVSDIAQTVVKQPAKIIEAVGRNPLPIIAIVVTIGIFIFGFKVPGGL